MDEFKNYFSKEKVRRIFMKLWENDMNSIHYDINSEIEIVFYNNGRILLKKSGEIITINEPIFTNNKDLDFLEENLDNFIHLLYKKFSILKIEKTQDGFKIDIKIDAKDFRYKKE